MSRDPLSAEEITTALQSLDPGWAGSTENLHRSIEFAGFMTAVEFVTRLAPKCEELDHHPDLAIRWRWVDVLLVTHSAGGVTPMDVQLAGIVDEVAAGLPLAAS